MKKYGETSSNKCCSVPQCKSRYSNEISLFYFPKDEAMKKRWTDATKIEKRVTQFMQVCSRHFVKNDYVLSEYPGVAKVRRLKKTAVPTQNLPWQFPNKRVSPSLAKARSERLKNRTQQKTSESVKHEPVEATETMEHGEGTSKGAAEPKIEDTVAYDEPQNENDEYEEKVEKSVKKNLVAGAKGKDQTT